MDMDEAVIFLNCSLRSVQRYIKDGRLPYKLEDGKKTFKKRDLRSIKNKVVGNRVKHRPNLVKPPADLEGATKRVEVKKIKAVIADKPTKALLNEIGKVVLLETTKLLKDNSLLDGIERSVILRYAIAVQMKEKFMSKAVHGFEDKFYFDIAKQFQQEIQHYEKELGLTPAALSKMKPKEDNNKEVDPMEDLLND